MSEYEQLRFTAQQLSDQMPENHPCKIGKGNCCEQTDIALTRDDYLLLVKAVQDGKIDKSVIEKAVENASNPDNTFCPFFDKKQRLCTIYEQRPLACAIYGIGTNMCEDCFVHSLMELAKDSFLIEDMVMVESIRDWIKVQEHHAISAVVAGNLAQLI